MLQLLRRQAVELLSTHSPVRIMFSVDLELLAKPSMQRQPTHQADDIGARLGEPSSLLDPIRTTGVPKYRIAGSITCEFAGSVMSMVRNMLASIQ
jgi:hypothetical protein